MSVWYVVLVVSINVALVVLWELFKKRRVYKKVNKVPEIHDLIIEGKYGEALSMLKKIEKYCPPVVYEMMGECYYGIGDKGKAKEFYIKALSLDSVMDLAHAGLAQIEIDKGDYAKAESFLKKALEIDKNNYIAMYHLARIYNIWGRYSDAAILLENAITNGLVLRDAYLMLRDYYQSSGDDAAVKRIDKKIELLDQRRN
ncbi:MAG: tetratricopeptide repeat protein [Desulfobacterales bacterium]|nr:tetratricopeptide repeat protein [Desulfobacterales bacterium]